MSEREALVRVCQGMIDIVERVGCKDWRDQHGRRLKDTKEWVEFYVTVNRAAEQAALTAPQQVNAEGREVALNVKHKDCHKAADAFWQYWRENGKTHKRGYYESTWGAINQALRYVGVVPHEYRKPRMEIFDCAVPDDCSNIPPAPQPQQEPVACCCGEPLKLGVVHRKETPCFYWQDPAPQPADGANKTAPFSNCKYKHCDLPGQCRHEGKCHHPLQPADGVVVPREPTPEIIEAILEAVCVLGITSDDEYANHIYTALLAAAKEQK